MKKTLSMLLAGAMLAAALTGCGSSASTGSDSADNSTDSSASGAAFKLGGTGPLTGAAAIYGNACKNGAQIAVDEINAEGGDIQFRERSPHIGISFIGTDHDITGRGHGKVRARHGCFRIQEKVAQVLAGSVRQVSRVEVSFLRTHFLFKKFAHLLAFDVNGGQDDVARFKMHQLKDTFAQIGFHDVNAALH